MNSYTIFFLFKPFTSIHTTILTKDNDYDENDPRLIKLGYHKILQETGIDVYELYSKIGGNDNFGKGWIIVEDNLEATEEELQNIPKQWRSL